MGGHEASQEREHLISTAARAAAAAVRADPDSHGRPPADEPLSPEEAELFARMRARLERVLSADVWRRADRRGGARGHHAAPARDAVAERPVVLMAHQDVVPVPEDWQAEGWEHPPFDGVIADGYVYGRGALDDKGALVVMLEAVEALLAEGWKPPRDLYLLMGADEEAYGDCAVAGDRAAGVARHRAVPGAGRGRRRRDRGVPHGEEGNRGGGGVRKGHRHAGDWSADGGGGHASTPPKRSAAGLVAAAICEIEEHPFPASVQRRHAWRCSRRSPRTRRARCEGCCAVPGRCDRCSRACCRAWAPRWPPWCAPPPRSRCWRAAPPTTCSRRAHGPCSTCGWPSGIDRG